MAGPVEADEIVAGKYRIEQELGGGGMGVVFSATHVHLEQRVALKFLSEESAKNPELVERFAREARAAVRIQSEHAVRVLDVGILGNGQPYIVMEYLDGADLEDIVQKSGPLAIDEAVRYVLQACEAIAEVHAQGIVHRDLKPANLFLTSRADGSKLVKVIDFGISKASSTPQQSSSLTRTSAVMGSPRYMSPEQLRASRDVDARADIWALGVTLYELLGGQSPFAGGTLPEVCASVLKDPPRPLRESRPDAPGGLEGVILRCLEKEAESRYQDLADLTAALAPFAPSDATVSVDRVNGVLRRAAASAEAPAAPLEAAAVTLRPGPASRSSNGLSNGAKKLELLERLGDLSRVPRLAIDHESISSLELDQRTGAFLSCVDGASSIDELLDVCGMDHPEALTILQQLLDARIVVIDASPRPR
ncbi:MAG: serine/threonine protein kinase [Polyangiaceae bacterium]|nr:serine/threonine protein kinase [Polyangiaceae bacterium]